MNNLLALIRFAYLAMKFVNWVTGKVDQKTWEESGYRKRMAEEAAQLQKSLGLAKAAATEVSQKTDEQVLKDLEKRGEIRD